jgi:hypothetical protein
MPFLDVPDIVRKRRTIPSIARLWREPGVRDMAIVAELPADFRIVRNFRAVLRVRCAAYQRPL